ncbi:MAG TPA: zinc ribbon domain-containing protein [Solirubrobacterales bacterium]
MADIDPQGPVFGEQGEPCQECGAPLAADQRYCLNCGRRRAEPRVDFQRMIGPSNEEDAAKRAQSDPAPAPVEPAKPERDYAPLAAVGGIAILGLMLLVGVLIGKGNNSPTAAPAPIVKVGGETGGTASAAESEESKTAAAKPKASKKSKGSGTGAKAVAGGLTGSAAKNSKATVQATTDDLENLNNQSGESYEETIKKLPDKIATPGKPPPIDTTKAPGGGGAAETIE